MWTWWWWETIYTRWWIITILPQWRMVLEHHFNYNGESSPLECIAKWWSETMANKWWVITIPIQWRMVQGHHFTCNGESSPVECIENGDQKPWPKNGEWSPFTHNEDGVGTLFYWQMVRVHHLNTLKMVIKHHDPQMVSDHHSSHGFYGAEKPFIRNGECSPDMIWGWYSFTIHTDQNGVLTPLWFRKHLGCSKS